MSVRVRSAIVSRKLIKPGKGGIPRNPGNMRQDIPNIQLRSRPVIGKFPLAREELLDLRVPCERRHIGRERGDISSIRKVVHQDPHRAHEERL